MELRRPVVNEDRWFLRNVTAGVFGGDSYEVALTCARGANARVEPTSATKVYAMPSAGAVSRVRLRAEAGSLLVWGPNTTILQSNSELASDIEVTLAGGRVLIAETVVMGRLATGEAFEFRRYDPSLTVWDENGRLLFKERAAYTPDQAFRDALGGRGVLSTVHALGFGVEDGNADRLTDQTIAYEFAGWSVLPNRAGLVAKALLGSGSEGESFARACTAALR